MKRAYSELHQLGFAHSVEVWQEGRLVGGLYGVSLGQAYFGESMFSRIPDASKIGLYHLCRQLAAWRFALIDCQIASSHLQRLGAKEISRERFLGELRRAVAAPGRIGTWRFENEVPSSREHLPEFLTP
jgi:leucyl/phenylalanyl-tRNA--protein transferase